MSITTSRLAGAKLAYSLTVDGHALTTDVNAELGGDDAGPDPHALLDASLAACTALTVTMFAQRKGWPLEDIHVKVTHDSSDESKGLYRLNRRIRLIGALDDAQRARLMEIAEKCPIHKLMHGKIEISTTPVISESEV